MARTAFRAEVGDAGARERDPPDDELGWVITMDGRANATCSLATATSIWGWVRYPASAVLIADERAARLEIWAHGLKAMPLLANDDGVHCTGDVRLESVQSGLRGTVCPLYLIGYGRRGRG